MAPNSDVPFHLCRESVPIEGDGPPTKDEMLVYYPAKFTWKQIKTFVNSGYALVVLSSIGTQQMQ